MNKVQKEIVELLKMEKLNGLQLEQRLGKHRVAHAYLKQMEDAGIIEWVFTSRLDGYWILTKEGGK